MNLVGLGLVTIFYIFNSASLLKDFLYLRIINLKNLLIMGDLYQKVEKPIKGSKWLIILFILIMIMWAIATFFGPIM